MSSFAGYLDTPTADIDELRAHFRPMFDKIAEANVERERDRTFPHEQVRLLNDAAFGTVRIPLIRGGFGASLEQTFLLLADLGEADANISHIWRNHLAFVEDRLNAPVSDTNDVWMNRFLGGEFVGGGWTEANNLTLANLATWLDVLGRDADGELLTALVRVDDPGVTLVDDWRGFGQRTTASGTARYERVRADRGDVFPAAERFTYQGHFYQIAMLSVLTGITRAALRDGSSALLGRKRIGDRRGGLGHEDVPSDDAQLLAVIGEVSADAFAADAALTLAGRALDRIVSAQIGGGAAAVRRRVIDAEVAVTQAQLVIIAAALRATTAIFDALGASGVSEERGLDRHWRNARTLASHNPRVYKARILGDWLINGKDPVSNLVALGRGGQGN